METLRARHIERCEEIPETPPPGNYVVIDVIFFSTTAVELFANGADCLTVTPSKSAAIERKRTDPDVVAGGHRTESYAPKGDADLYNSPSYVQDVDVDGRAVYMSSTNGTRAIDELTDRAADAGVDIDVYIGSTTNAAAVADVVGEDDKPTYLLSAGTQGDVAVEDNWGAVAIGREIEGVPLTPVERSNVRRHLEVARGESYLTEAHPVRRADLTEYITAINSRDVVPKLEDGSFVDVASDFELTSGRP